MKFLQTKALLQVMGLSLLMACSSYKDSFDATGSFEGEETVLSAEVGGTLTNFTAREGLRVKKGDLLACIDSTQLHLKKEQLLAQVRAIRAKKNNEEVQTAALRTQLAYARNEYKRFKNLLAGGAATNKQVDDLKSQTELLQSQLQALQSGLQLVNKGIEEDTQPLLVQVTQTNDMLKKCRLLSPLNGIVQYTYASKYETTVPGKALIVIVNMDTMTLRAYISGNQLATVKLNQKVKVSSDDGKGGMRETAGILTWISQVAEFTPKTIQTKDERANMVYAIKIKVVNDGTIKSGMYGEVRFK